MKKIFSTLAAPLFAAVAQAVARFPKPDFSSGYEYPDIEHGVPWELVWNWVDLALLAGLMSLVAWALHKRLSRKIIFTVSVVSVAWFGFFRSGCVCSVGSIQNVALAAFDNSYQLPWFVAAVFLLPIVFTLLFGRVFCAGVCPLGALQEVVNVKNFRVSRAVSRALGVIPWVYLAFAILYAATRSQFIICHFDPFVPIFRLGGDVGMIAFGLALLVLSTFVGRPFCRWLCPYGALLSLFARVSLFKMEVSRRACINCALCHNSCPVDALRPPYANRPGEERSRGTRRLLSYLVVLPLLTCSGALLLGMNSDALSRLNRDVFLLEQVEYYAENTELEPPLEVRTFSEMGRSIDDLQEKAAAVQSQFRSLCYPLGALIGLAIGLNLVSLSLKRTRRTYEIDHSACVACGKCFNYCPQNVKR